MNRKRWTKILMGAVYGVMLTAVSTTMTSGQNAVETPPSQAPEDPAAFVCEARIGNVASNPTNPWGGTFEIDISTNTASPWVTKQYGWVSGDPTDFQIDYTPPTSSATTGFLSFQMGVDTNGVSVVAATNITAAAQALFSQANGYTDIHLRARAINVNSYMKWQNLQLWVKDAAGNYQWYPLDRTEIGTDEPNDMHTMLIPAVPGMQRGFIMTGQAVLTWDATVPANVPANSRINGQISFHERSGVVKVDWVGANVNSESLEGYGGGYRVYPEKVIPTSSIETNAVMDIALAKPVQIAGSNLYTNLYVKVFDMDDPTQNVLADWNAVDPNDYDPFYYPEIRYNGNDNRRPWVGEWFPGLGGDHGMKMVQYRCGKFVPYGELWIVEYGDWSAVPNPGIDGIVEIPMYPGDQFVQVKTWIYYSQPGNNWKSVTSFDRGYFTNLDVDPRASCGDCGMEPKGLHFKRTAATSQTEISADFIVPQCMVSPLLSVWRTLHIERDSMGHAGPNTMTTYVVPRQVASNRVRLINDRFGVNELEDGKLFLGVLNRNGDTTDIYGPFSILSNTYARVATSEIVFTPPLTPQQMTSIDGGRSIRVTASDDDNNFLLPHVLDGRGNLNPPAGHVAEADVDYAYAKAYIRVVYDDVLNARKIIPFQRHLGLWGLAYDIDDAQDLHSEQYYWVSLAVACFEPSRETDGDPDSYSSTLGMLKPSLVSAAGEDLPVWGVTLLDINKVAIFMETIRDTQEKESLLFGMGKLHPESLILAHELAHTGGADHTLRGIMLADPRREVEFDDVSIEKIRSVSVW